MERTWKQSPQAVSICRTQKNPRYQKLHGAIGEGEGAVAPPPLPGSEMLLLIVLLLLRGCPQCNFVTAVGIENTLMTPLPECLKCADVSIPLDTEPALRTRQIDVRQMSDALHRLMPLTLWAGHNNILRQHISPVSAPCSAGPQSR